MHSEQKKIKIKIKSIFGVTTLYASVPRGIDAGLKAKSGIYSRFIVRYMINQ